MRTENESLYFKILTEIKVNFSLPITTTNTSREDSHIHTLILYIPKSEGLQKLKIGPVV